MGVVWNVSGLENRTRAELRVHTAYRNTYHRYGKYRYLLYMNCAASHLVFEGKRFPFRHGGGYATVLRIFGGDVEAATKSLASYRRAHTDMYWYETYPEFIERLSYADLRQRLHACPITDLRMDEHGNLHGANGYTQLLIQRSLACRAINATEFAAIERSVLKHRGHMLQ